MANLPNMHPGEILREEFLAPLELSQNRMARDINVSPRRINEIVHGRRAVTADTALRLARYFGSAPPEAARPPPCRPARRASTAPRGGPRSARWPLAAR